MKWLLPLLAAFVLSCQSSKNGSQNPYESATPRKQREVIGLIPRGLDLATAPEKIVFGCCGDQNQPQPIWTAIYNENPDLLITMGDNIIADSSDRRPILDQYKKLVQNEAYKKARESIPFMATWDDLDYGQNQGGASNPDKEEARKAFWFQYPYVKDSTLLDQSGIFHSKILGGIRVGRGRRARTTPSVHVIMLDTRWNRTAPDATNATLLGSEQWAWLEDQLDEKANFKILVSSIPVLTENEQEDSWFQIPSERNRLLNLIKRKKPKNLLLLSGDRRTGSISKLELEKFGTLYEITAGSYNLPVTVKEGQQLFPSDSYPNENYGVIALDLPRGKVTVSLKDLKGQTIQNLEIKLSK